MYDGTNRKSKIENSKYGVTLCGSLYLLCDLCGKTKPQNLPKMSHIKGMIDLIDNLHTVVYPCI